MAHSAGERENRSRRALNPNRPPGPAESVVRRACFVLWILTAMAEAALIARFGAMWVYGRNATGAASLAIVTDLYALTSLLVAPFTNSANISLPPAGLNHIFDVAAFLAIDVLFFGVLAITKLCLWTARRWDVRAEQRAQRPSSMQTAAEPDQSTVRVPMDSTAQ